MKQCKSFKSKAFFAMHLYTCLLDLHNLCVGFGADDVLPGLYFVKQVLLLLWYILILINFYMEYCTFFRNTIH